MAGAVEKPVSCKAIIEEIELNAAEMEELDQLAEDTRKCGLSWKDLKAELNL